jgi:Protein of unknown function (DUF2934)
MPDTHVDAADPPSPSMSNQTRTRRRSDPGESRAAMIVPDRAMIEVRAYELYLEGGACDGNDVADWLRAEQELFSPDAEVTRLTRGLNETAGN